MRCIADCVVADVNTLLDRSACMRALDLPKVDNRNDSQQARWLQLVYTQKELRALCIRCLSVLDTFSMNDPEWDVLTELMDPLWLALTPENQP